MSGDSSLSDDRLDADSLRIVEVFEAAWETGRPDVRAHHEQHPGRPLRLLLELAAIDLENRSRRGEAVGAAEYLERFPQLAADASCGRELRRVAGRAAARRAGAAAAFPYLAPATEPGAIGELAHYRVIRVLGQGAFGTVFEAFDGKLHRRVAIKVLSPELATTSPPRKRFIREARAMAAVSHDNIVRVHAVEEAPTPYLVMEYVDGGTLHDRMDRTGPLPASEAVHVGRQVAAALAAAHEQGLIHRDVKPANMLLERGGTLRVKLTDFGLARAADDASMTRTGTVVGTPLYMSPEQAAGGTVDHRSDLFSLGSVLYALVTGRAPFRAPSSVAVLKRVVDDTPRPIAEIVPETPPWLVDLINRLLEKKPEDRIQSACEVEGILARAQAGEVAPAASPPAARAADVRAVARPASESSGPRSGGWAWLAVIPVAAACLAAGWLGWRSLGTTVPAPRIRRAPASAAAPLPADAPPATDATAATAVPVTTAASVAGPAGWEPGFVRRFGNFVERRRHHEGIPGIVASPTSLPGVRRWQAVQRLPSCQVTGIATSPRGQIAVGTRDGIVRILEEDSMRLLHVLGPHERAVVCDAGINIAYSPDGSWLASVGFDGIMFWEAATARSTDLFPLSALFDSSPLAVVWHPGGHMVAVSLGHEVVMVAPPGVGGRPEIVGRWRNRDDNVARGDGLADVRDLAWSPDGARLACVGWERADQRVKTNGVVLLDETASQIGSIPETTDASRAEGQWSVAWSPDGSRIAVGSHAGGVTLYPVSGGDPTVLVADGDRGHPVVMRWHRDGDRLLCGWSALLMRLHTLNRGIENVVLDTDATFQGHLHDKRLAFAADGETFFYARGGYDLCRRRIADNTLVFDAAYPREDQRAWRDAVRWTADGRLVIATGSERHAIRIVSAEGAVVAGPWTTTLSRKAAGLQLHPHPTDGDLLAMHSQDGQAAITSSDGRRQSMLTPSDSFWLCGVAWILGGKRLAVGRARSADLLLYDTEAFAYPEIKLPQTLAVYKGVQERRVALACATSTMESLLGTAVGDDGVLTLFRLDATGRTGSKPIRTTLTECRQVAIDDSGRWAAARYVENGRFVVLDVAEDAVRTFDDHSWTVGDIGWSSRGPSVVSAGWDGRCFLWDPQTDERRCFETVNDIYVSAAADPVTGLVAVKTEGSVVHCFDPDSLAVRWSLTTLPEDGQATFSAGGALLHGDPGLVEKHVAYVVDRDDGRREILSHSEFVALVTESTKHPVAAPSPPDGRQ